MYVHAAALRPPRRYKVAFGGQADAAPLSFRLYLEYARRAAPQNYLANGVRIKLDHDDDDDRNGGDVGHAPESKRIACTQIA